MSTVFLYSPCLEVDCARENFPFSVILSIYGQGGVSKGPGGCERCVSVQERIRRTIFCGGDGVARE